MRINEGFQDDSGSTVTLKSVTSVIIDEINPGADPKADSQKWRSKIFNSSSDSGIDSGGVRKSGSRNLNGGGTEASTTASEGGSSNDSTVEVESVNDEVLEEELEEEQVENAAKPEEQKEVVAILGSGDFGRALAGRLVQAGYVVNIGSRDPQRNA